MQNSHLKLKIWETKILRIFSLGVSPAGIERRAKGFEAAFAASTELQWEPLLRLGMVYLSVSDILIRFSVSVSQTLIWQRSPGTISKTRECHSRRRIINTWSEQTGEAAGREEPPHVGSQRYVSKWKCDNQINYNVCFITSCIEDQLDEHQARAGVCRWLSEGDLTSCFQAPGWSPLRAKQCSINDPLWRI